MKTFISTFVLVLATLTLTAQPGTLDLTFNPGSGANNEYVRRIVVQPDGKILVAGEFTQFNGQNFKYLVRLNANGSLDETFNTGSGFNGAIGDIALQSNGKIIVGGSFSSFNGTSAQYLLRLNADGSRDGNFSTGTGPNGSVGCILAAPDGDIFISGNFNSFNGVMRNRIAKLGSNGSLATSFDPLVGLDGLVYAMALQNDGALLIGGNFSNFNNIPVGRIAKILSNGQPDPSFNPGTAIQAINQHINSISLQSDGKIIAAGLFTSFNGQTIRNIVRLLPNGQIDPLFTPPTFSDQLESVVSLPNGKIAVGGRFTSSSPLSRKYLTMLNNNGTIDETFNYGTGPTALIFKVAPYGSDKLMIGGYFTSYNGTSRGRIARINVESFTHLPEKEINTKLANYSWSNSIQTLNIKPLRENKLELHVFDLNGHLVRQQTITGESDISFTGLREGIYHFVLRDGHYVQTERLIKL